MKSLKTILGSAILSTTISCGADNRVNADLETSLPQPKFGEYIREVLEKDGGSLFSFYGENYFTARVDDLNDDGVNDLSYTVHPSIAFFGKKSAVNFSDYDPLDSLDAVERQFVNAKKLPLTEDGKEAYRLLAEAIYRELGYIPIFNEEQYAEFQEVYQQLLDE